MKAVREGVRIVRREVWMEVEEEGVKVGAQGEMTGVRFEARPWARLGVEVLVWGGEGAAWGC